jgi:NADH-quinone oxidoreductase subunit C
VGRSLSTDAPTTGSEAAEAAEAAEAEEAPARDEQREAIVARLTESLGDAIVEHHIRPGDDLWVRVTRESWQEAGRVARDRLGCRYFGFLSAIDWLPSPYGRYLDAEVDKLLGTEPIAADTGVDAAEDSDEVPDEVAEVVEQAGEEPSGGGLVTGYAGGATRFQVFARVANIKEHWGITLKVDLPDDDLSVDTWVGNYHGANWHERETWEMFGITFVGHPFLRHLYLPGAFEGNPLRKDFPLLARVVKPWPGIVDVEEMPALPDQEGEGGSEAREEEASTDAAGGDA